MRTANDVKRACEYILSKKGLEMKPDGTTFCNWGLRDMLAELGLERHVSERGITLRANDIVGRLEDTCRQLTFSEAFEEANKGGVVIAGLRMPEHGHVALVYPFPAKFASGKWGRTDIPCVANIGKENGVMPLNWAFGAKPLLFLLAPATDA